MPTPPPATPVPEPAPRLRVLVASAAAGEVGELAMALGEAGHEIVTAYRAEAAVQRFAEERPDVTLLAPDLPGDAPGRLIARMKARGDGPILVLADVDDEALVVSLLDAGADDVIARPTRRLELVARVNAAARRRSRVPALPPPTLDGLVVDVDRHSATITGRDLSLTPTELELLAMLAARQGGIVDHRTLIRALWPDDPTVDHDVLRTHLGRLNAKLVAEGHPGLRNVRGRGYGLRIAGGALAGDATATPTRAQVPPSGPSEPIEEAAPTVADRGG
jgi:two-component system response regulator RegX3